MKQNVGKRSIFRALFVPMIFIMILQALIFYLTAIYGGIEDSLRQNASDVFSERLYGRKNEVETSFNNRWTALDDCIAALDEKHSLYEDAYGQTPLLDNAQLQIAFLRDSAGDLIDMLRYSETNGIFLIVNDSREPLTSFPVAGEQKYGLCIRDMDQNSNYSGTEDLLLERSPSSIIDSLGCSLDSWWEAKYSFGTLSDGDYYYAPLNAAWELLGGTSKDLAYISAVHRISESDTEVITYSVPLLTEDGFPYAVLGVELSVNYLESLLPNAELGTSDKCSYVLALHETGSDTYEPMASTGALYKHCLSDESVIMRGETTSTGGFTIIGQNGEKLYAVESALDTYNNNSPFESRQLVLLAITESTYLFSYVDRIKTSLMIVSLVSLLLGTLGLAIVSQRFASPITALAARVRGMEEYKPNDSLGRLGITEIDQLVDSIENLNRNVSRNSARTEFFSRMSHDLRTPMNAIISFSSPEMLENADEATKNDYLGNIHDSGVYLLGLINEVLDMTKIESNKTGLAVSPTQASRLFDTPIHMIERLAQKNSITFTAHLLIPPELWVMADAQHLSQIVMNLLSNAVKFTPAGGAVRLSVDILKEAPAKQLQIVVSDTGIGMSEEFLQKLYMPFEQENSSHEGTGLSLSIAKKLTELMGGTIECRSRQNEGTVFTVRLPLVPADAAAPAAQSDSKSQTADITALKGKRVLVCEDNAINAKIITLLLERIGLLVDVAENGSIGVSLFQSSATGAYDLILMDIRMPVMDGFEATKTIRSLPRDDAAGVPIIALTADAFAVDAKNSLSAGMNEHLSKPIEPELLYKVLLKHII